MINAGPVEVTDTIVEPEEPEESGGDRFQMAFSKTEDMGGGGSSTVTTYLDIPQLGDENVDDVVLALLPVLEVDGWEFQHIRVTTTQVSTYDPRIS